MRWRACSTTCLRMDFHRAQMCLTKEMCLTHDQIEPRSPDDQRNNVVPWVKQLMHFCTLGKWSNRVRTRSTKIRKFKRQSPRPFVQLFIRSWRVHPQVCFRPFFPELPGSIAISNHLGFGRGADLNMLSPPRPNRCSENTANVLGVMANSALTRRRTALAISGSRSAAGRPGSKLVAEACGRFSACWIVSGGQHRSRGAVSNVASRRQILCFQVVLGESADVSGGCESDRVGTSRSALGTRPHLISGTIDRTRPKFGSKVGGVGDMSWASAAPAAGQWGLCLDDGAKRRWAEFWIAGRRRTNLRC